MTRVATYARYSTDKQRPESIPDKQRSCAEYAPKGWTFVAEFSDAELSGDLPVDRRPGIRAMMRAALNGEFDVLLAESLDRFSRDLEHTASIFKKLTFAGVRIVTVAEGDISFLHIGFKGTMNALYLKDLADKTRRGLRGLVEDGKSAGGRSYGYRVVSRGELEIIPEQAEIVRRIFRAFVAGVSPKAIAKTLNTEGIAGPRAAWGPSTIHGHARRGTGILNNALYIGKYFWGKQRYVKDPVSGKRVARPNPPSERCPKDRQHLRIIDDDLWEAVKARQAATRHTTQAGIVRARRPKYLFTGLTKCGACGGGFILSSHDLLTCFNARNRGTCTNRRSIKRQEVEARVLRAMKERFFEPGAFAEFCAGFTEELNALRREHRMKLAAAPREIVGIKRRSQEILNLLLEGFRNEEWKEELRRLDERRAELMKVIEAGETDLPSPALHSRMAEVFRQKTMQLAAALERDEEHDAARQALRGFLDKIVIPPGDGLLQVVGNLGEMLTAASGRKSVVTAVGYVGCGGPQLALFGVLLDGSIGPLLPDFRSSVGESTGLLSGLCDVIATHPPRNWI